MQASRIIDLVPLIVNVRAAAILIFLCCDADHKGGEINSLTFTLNL
jgi:hypothetical protein